MDQAIIEPLLSAGPLGAVVIALGVAYWRQSRALAEAHTARVEDAKKVAETLLELNDKWNGTVNNLTAAVNELRASIPHRRSGTYRE